MYGVEVDIWADNTEIRSITEAWSTLPPPEGAPTANMNQTNSIGLNDQTFFTAKVGPNILMALMISGAILVFPLALIILLNKKLSFSSLLKPKIFSHSSFWFWVIWLFS